MSYNTALTATAFFQKLKSHTLSVLTYLFFEKGRLCYDFEKKAVSQIIDKGRNLLLGIFRFSKQDG